MGTPAQTACTKLQYFSPTTTMSRVLCNDVEVRESTLCQGMDISFDGAFARRAFTRGEEVERGVVRRLPENFEGDEWQLCFTWSDEVPNRVWAVASGCAPFYNTALPEESNTKMHRDFKKDAFIITATRDIEAGEELFHTYKSLSFRRCFSDLNEMLISRASSTSSLGNMAPNGGSFNGNGNGHADELVLLRQLTERPPSSL